MNLSELATKAGDAAALNEGRMGKSRERCGCDTAHWVVYQLGDKLRSQTCARIALRLI